MKQVEQSSAIRCDLTRNGSSNDNLIVTFTSTSNAQNLSKYRVFFKKVLHKRKEKMQEKMKMT